MNVCVCMCIPAFAADIRGNVLHKFPQVKNLLPIAPSVGLFYSLEEYCLYIKIKSQNLFITNNHDGVIS